MSAHRFVSLRISSSSSSAPVTNHEIVPSFFTYFTIGNGWCLVTIVADLHPGSDCAIDPRTSRYDDIGDFGTGSSARHHQNTIGTVRSYNNDEWHDPCAVTHHAQCQFYRFSYHHESKMEWLCRSFQSQCSRDDWQTNLCLFTNW